jgi:hypothetical protein
MGAGQRLWRNPRKGEEVRLDRIINADDMELHIEVYEKKEMD